MNPARRPVLIGAGTRKEAPCLSRPLQRGSLSRAASESPQSHPTHHASTSNSIPYLMHNSLIPSFRMLRSSLTTLLVPVIAVHAIPGTLPSSSMLDPDVPTDIDGKSSHLSTEAIISIISVVVTIIIGIVTLAVTIIGIALAWWQWKTSRGTILSRIFYHKWYVLMLCCRLVLETGKANSLLDLTFVDHPMYGHTLMSCNPTSAWTRAPRNAERLPQNMRYFQMQYEHMTMRSSTP